MPGFIALPVTLVCVPNASYVYRTVVVVCPLTSTVCVSYPRALYVYVFVSVAPPYATVSLERSPAVLYAYVVMLPLMPAD